MHYWDKKCHSHINFGLHWLDLLRSSSSSGQDIKSLTLMNYCLYSHHFPSLSSFSSHQIPVNMQQTTNGGSYINRERIVLSIVISLHYATSFAFLGAHHCLIPSLYFSLIPSLYFSLCNFCSQVKKQKTKSLEDCYYWSKGITLVTFTSDNVPSLSLFSMPRLLDLFTRYVLLAFKLTKHGWYL